MPPEDITPYENIDTDGSLEAGRTGVERSDAARRPDSDNESTSGPIDSRTADYTENTPTPPLGLRRSDRNRGGSISLSGRSQPPLTTRQSPPRPSAGLQSDLDRLVRESLRSLDTQRRDLQREVEQLERRKARIETEMKQSFAGSSQDIAIRVQGFKDYLVGSLQDLATAAEQVNLVPKPMVEPPPAAPQTPASTSPSNDDGDLVSMAGNRFAEQRDRIYSLLDQYRTRPDYYGPPWQLRRTFEPVHAERVSNWFFTQGSRGAVKSMGSRLQNVLVASAAISCLYAICILFTISDYACWCWRRPQSGWVNGGAGCKTA